MSFISAIPGLLRPAKDVVEVFKENAEGRAERAHTERLALTEQDLASLKQFAAEFHDRSNRTRWDAFIDGLNRVPRPLITIGVLGFFVLAPLDPVRFVEIAKAYELMPDGFWALISVIIAFYFGGRMQLKSQDMTLKKTAIEAAIELAGDRRAEAAAAATMDEVPPPASETTGNRVIEEWHRRQAA